MFPLENYNNDINPQDVEESILSDFGNESFKRNSNKTWKSKRQCFSKLTLSSNSITNVPVVDLDRHPPTSVKPRLNPLFSVPLSIHHRSNS